MTTTTDSTTTEQLATCPDWCTRDHREHVAYWEKDPDAGIWHDGESIRIDADLAREIVDTEVVSVHLESWQPSKDSTDLEPFVAIPDGNLDLPPASARELAAALVRLADQLDGAGR